MVVLLVTWVENLDKRLQILSSELNYRAIVVDDVESARKILESYNLPTNSLYPLYDLKECVRDFYYDFILCVDDSRDNKFVKLVKKYGAPANKIVGVISSLRDENFTIKRMIKYFKEHSAEFDIFVTGNSFTEYGLDVTCFKSKVFNFGLSYQDLYYGLQIAKYVIQHGKNIKYALIGLYGGIFHHDASKGIIMSPLMLYYFIAFGDLHNFRIQTDIYKSFFREEYLYSEVSLESFDLTKPTNKCRPLEFMTPETRFDMRNWIDLCNERYSAVRAKYPETCKENIKILDEYLNLCEKNGIRPILVRFPTTEAVKKHMNKQICDEFYYLVNEACRKYSSALFFDGSKLQGFTDADFYDFGHMNAQGAAKFSIALNDFIEQLEKRETKPNINL